MKFVLLVASLVSALVSAALGFDIISVNNTAADLNHLIAGWAAWSFALFVGASLVSE